MKPILAFWGALCAGIGVGTAQAAGFALIEQNASGLGNAYAGQAAVAQDASTVFFNPAGLTHIEGRQAVVAGHLIAPSAKLTVDSASTLSPPYGGGGDAGVIAFVPNFYYAMDIMPDLKFGIGVNSPFGLVTEYDVPWAGQTQAVKSDMKTYNVNPSLSWKANDRLSLGFGLNWQRIEAELTQAGNAAAVPPIATMQGDDDSLGWNAGLLVNLEDGSRVGLSYRSEISHHLTGTVSLGGLVNSVYADLDLPATASLSYFKPVSSRWDVLADLTWTGWSSFQKLAVIKVSGPLPAATPIQENWEDALRFSLGMNYHQSDKWSWRIGVAYDETPVPDAAHRTPRIPDADRQWIAVGGQYRMSPKAKIDFGFAHLFVNKASINHSENGVTLVGTYNNHVDILSAQYTHNF